MKRFFAIALLGLALSLVSCGKREAAGSTLHPAAAAAEVTYNLAKSDLLPPVGKTRIISSIIDMKDFEIIVFAEENAMTGTMSRNWERVETAEPISADKLRHTIISESDGIKVTMEGQGQPAPEKASHLAGIPIIVEVKDGMVTAALENGAPTSEQEPALESILKHYESNGDFIVYGDSPRKPGERWVVDPAKLSNFAGGTGYSGSFIVEFKAVEVINGVNCAKLECIFDLAGKTLSEGGGPQMSLAMKGSAEVIRSIDDFFDIEVKLHGTMTVEGEVAGATKMKMVGPMELHRTTELK